MTEEASTYNRLKIVYSINGVGKIGTDTCRKMKLDHLLTAHTRINSKWIKDFNVRPEMIKLLEENIGSKISGIACSKFLSDISPLARETKEKLNKWDIKLKSLLHSKGNHQQNKKTTHRMGENTHRYI